MTVDLPISRLWSGTERRPSLSWTDGRASVPHAAVMLLLFLFFCLQGAVVRASSSDESPTGAAPIEGAPLDVDKPLNTLPPQPLHYAAPSTLAAKALLPTRSLPMLEAQMTAAPEVLIAAAELDETMSRLDHLQARSGLELRGNAGAGRYRELVSTDDTRDYSEAVVGGGLRYPLLGRYEQQRVDIARAEARTWESRHKLAMAHLEGLKALRSHYIDYWGSTKKIDLSRAFLAKQEEVERIIGHRTETGHMLEADRLGFLTTFGSVRRTLARMHVVQHRSLRTLNLLTGQALGPFSPETPALPRVSDDLAALQSAALDNHPEIQRYRSLVDEQLGILEMTHLGDLDAYVDLGGFASREDSADDNEYGLAVNLTVSLPVDIRRANRAERKAILAALKKAQLQLDFRSDQLMADVESAFLLVRSEKRNLQFARQRLEAAIEGLREKLLRANRLPGDTLEQLEQSRFQYYLAAIDLVDAHMSVYRHQAGLLAQSALPRSDDRTPASEAFVGFDSIINDNYLRPLWLQAMPEAMRSKPVDEGIEPLSGHATSSGYGAYVWDSRRLPMDQPRNDFFWNHLRENGIDRLLVSFDGRQLHALRSGKERAHLLRFLETARDRKVRIELLLGEPLWILPSHRQDLLTIIQHMAELPFAALHLDLEPNQLDEARYDETHLLAQLIRTLQAVKRISPWPVGLSIHPRYLDDDRTELCLGCALTNIGLDELTLMIYIARPQRVSEIARSIQRRFPALRISVAQSVEPILSAAESYAEKGRSHFGQQMQALSDAMAGGNFNGILIQSFEDYMDMKP